MKQAQETHYYHTISDDLATALIPHLGIYSGYAAAFVSHLDYWLTQNDKAGFITNDGKKWIYNTYGEWSQKFTYLSVHIIGRIIRKLEAIGVLIAKRVNELYQIGFKKAPSHFHHDDRTKWYRLNYGMLKSLLVGAKTASEANVHSCTMEDAPPHHARCRSACSIQRSPKTTKDNNSVVEKKNDFCQSGGLFPPEPPKGQMGKEYLQSPTQPEATATLSSLNEVDLWKLNETEEEQFSAPPVEDVKKCNTPGTEIELEQPAQEKKIKVAVEAAEPASQEKAKSVVNQTVNEKASKHLDRLDELGVRLNPTLIKLVRTTQAEIVETAIATYQQYRRHHYVNNPAGFVVSAIKNRFSQPNNELPNDETTFYLWYDRMLQMGRVKGWLRGENGEILVEDIFWGTQPTPWENWIKEGWTMEQVEKAWKAHRRR